MSFALISDIFEEEVYTDMKTNNRVESTAFAESGVAVTNPDLLQAASSGARRVEVPYWNDLSRSEPSYGDDSDDDIVPEGVDTDSLMGRNAYINKSFGATDISAEIGGRDPMQRIRDRFGAYWQYTFSRRINAIAVGLWLDNVAANGGDMTHDVSLETTVGVDDDNRIGHDAVTEAFFTLGDRFGALSVIAMHSIPYKRLVKEKLIEMVDVAGSTLKIPTYLGARVVIDDDLPVIAGTTSGFRYLTVMYGGGVIGYADVKTMKKPVELHREPTKGKGSGREQLIERKTWLIHPDGYNWTDSSVSAASATLTDLRNPANWERKMDRKKIPIAFLVTNG